MKKYKFTAIFLIITILGLAITYAFLPLIEPTAERIYLQEIQDSLDNYLLDFQTLGSGKQPSIHPWDSEEFIVSYTNTTTGKLETKYYGNSSLGFQYNNSFRANETSLLSLSDRWGMLFAKTTDQFASDLVWIDLDGNVKNITLNPIKPSVISNPVETAEKFGIALFGTDKTMKSLIALVELDMTSEMLSTKTFEVNQTIHNPQDIQAIYINPFWKIQILDQDNSGDTKLIELETESSIVNSANVKYSSKIISGEVEQTLLIHNRFLDKKPHRVLLELLNSTNDFFHPYSVQILGEQETRRFGVVNHQKYPLRYFDLYNMIVFTMNNTIERTLYVTNSQTLYPIVLEFSLVLHDFLQQQTYVYPTSPTFNQFFLDNEVVDIFRKPNNNTDILFWNPSTDALSIMTLKAPKTYEYYAEIEQQLIRQDRRNYSPFSFMPALLFLPIGIVVDLLRIRKSKSDPVFETYPAKEIDS